MRAPLRLLVLLLVPCSGLAALMLPGFSLDRVAGAQEAAAEAPSVTGELLLAAADRRVDRLIHVPDLPAFLAAARSAGLGPAAAWRAAFGEQLSRWSGGAESKRFERGAMTLLAAADGEALFVSLPVPPVPGCGPRGTVLALRTSADEATLKRALEDLIAGGLGAPIGGEARAQQIGGRTVLALATSERTLYLAAQDGLVAAADHPLALGLLYRGLEAAESRPHGDKRMTVRRGVGDRAWTGWMFADRESLSGPLSGPPVAAPIPGRLPTAFAVAMSSPGDMPFLPAPPPAWVAETPTSGAVSVVVGEDGAFALAGAGGAPPPPGDGRSTLERAGMWLHAAASVAAEILDPPRVDAPGGAHVLGVLRALARGRLALPVEVVDRDVLLGPLEAAEAAADAPPIQAWEARDTAGELRGPAFHGPATFLALRLLHDTVGGPGTPDEPGTASGVPLPPPTELPPLPTPDGEK